MACTYMLPHQTDTTLRSGEGGFTSKSRCISHEICTKCKGASDKTKAASNWYLCTNRPGGGNFLFLLPLERFLSPYRFRNKLLFLSMYRSGTPSCPDCPWDFFLDSFRSRELEQKWSEHEGVKWTRNSSGCSIELVCTAGPRNVAWVSFSWWCRQAFVSIGVAGPALPMHAAYECFW